MLTLSGVHLEANTAKDGGALAAVNTQLYAVRTSVVLNTSSNLTIHLEESETEFDNLLLYENQFVDSFSGLYAEGGSLTVTNATIAGNYVGIYTQETTVSVRNSILFDNEYALADDSNGPAVWDVMYNDVYGNVTNYYGLNDPTGLLGNLSEDPGFVSWTRNLSVGSDNLRLGPSSTLVDMGDPMVLDTDGSRSDIGAYGGPGGGW